VQSYSLDTIHGEKDNREGGKKDKEWDRPPGENLASMSRLSTIKATPHVFFDATYGVV
jgi:hypothetical protein